MKLDLSSLESVRNFSAQVNKKESRLDVLINNAGVANAFGKKITEDGLELTMATNQYGPFLLTHLLLRKLSCMYKYKKKIIFKVIVLFQIIGNLYTLG